MADIRQIIQTTPEGPSFALRSDAYRPGDAQELIADVVALANVATSGKRYIVFGVEGKSGSDERKVPGIGELPNTQMWTQLVREYVEPEVRIEYRTETLAKRKVGVLIVTPGGAPPFMLKRTLGTLERGAAFIRRGTTRDRLLRADFEAIYARRYDYATRFAGLRVGFTADEPMETLSLTRQQDTALPSYPHTTRLRELIEARSYVDQVAANGDSGIVRMVHVRVYGGDVPYQSKSVAELQQELEGLRFAYREEDHRARYERDAARVNLSVRNDCEEALEDAALVLHFPVAPGFEVLADDVPASSSHVAGKRESAAISFACRLGNIQPGTRVEVFPEALRIVVTAQCKHRLLPVRYELRAANLPLAKQGKLRFEVA